MSTLSSVLQAAIAARYPAITWSDAIKFRPMLDLSRGELSSTAAIEIARTLRGDAASISQALVTELQSQIDGDWKIVAGYMILSQAPNSILKEEAAAPQQLFRLVQADDQAQSIVCLVPDATTPVYGRLRLIACSALQALLCVAFEGRARLAFEPEGPRMVRSADDVVKLTSQAVLRCLQSAGESRVDIDPSVLAADSAQSLTVWTSHHYHERLTSDTKRRLSLGRLSGEVALKIPSDGWLLSRDRALAELLSGSSLQRVVDRFSGHKDWLRWIFHFASATSSGDLDPSVALYDESASPLWNLEILRRRVSQLLPGHLHTSWGELSTIVLSEPLLNRDLLLRAMLLPLITARAMQEGEVLAWSGVVGEFATLAHATLNAPSFRRNLAQIDRSRKADFSTGLLLESAKPAVSLALDQISAGIVMGVASILPLTTEE